jgi:toxin ParE1/3/4
MARYELTALARSDLVALADYTVATWSAAQVRTYLDALGERLGLLAERPTLGRERSELGPNVRSFLVESHIVYYVTSPSGIVVLRILHKRQDAFRNLSGD